jgi:hypothetical protein
MKDIIHKWKVKLRSAAVQKEMAKKPKLAGDCNMCGMCCVIDAPEGGFLKCMNLIVRDWSALGQPSATRCSYHESRYDGMGIYFVDESGKLRGEGKCHTGDAEAEAIIERRLIGRGCSLSLEV